MPSRLKRHDNFGDIHFLTFCCHQRLQFFRHEIVRDAFIETMQHLRDKLNIRWIGYVIMPEHVHLAVLPLPKGAAASVSISEVLHDLKGLSGKACKAALREVWRDDRSLGTAPLDAWARGNGPKPFWKPRGYDFNMTHEEKIFEKLEYMHANPVRRNLVVKPEDWSWSSYRFFHLTDGVKIEMDWNGKLPLVL